MNNLPFSEQSIKWFIIYWTTNKLINYLQFNEPKIIPKSKISNTKKLIENLEFYTLEYEETLWTICSELYVTTWNYHLEPYTKKSHYM